MKVSRSPSAPSPRPPPVHTPPVLLSPTRRYNEVINNKIGAIFRYKIPAVPAAIIDSRCWCVGGGGGGKGWAGRDDGVVCGWK